MTICPDQLWKALHHVWPSAKLPALPDLPQQLSLRTDSRALAAGDVFVAVPGSQRDGREYIEQALAKGASLVLAHTKDSDIGLEERVLFLPHLSLRLGELGRALFDVPRGLEVIAVTGTNGKSSVTHYVAELSEQLGTQAGVIGTLGVGRPGKLLESGLTTPGPLALQATLGELARQGVKRVALEASSHALDQQRLDAVDVNVAVFTNLTPDHLDRHAGMGGYFAAKRRLFAEGGPDRAVIGVDEDEGLFLAGQLSEGESDDRVIRISARQKLSGGAGWTVFARKGFLSEYRKGRQAGSIDLRDIPGLPGAHNHQNACAAYAAARTLGLAPRVIEAAMRTYPGLPHRSQRIAEADGVSYVNDSKATNVDSAAKALSAFKKIRWICGGLEKEGGLEALKGATDDVLKAYVIGREAAQFAMQLDVEAEVCTTMERAVACAVAEAEPGDVVLLAPAAASFDQYDNFEQRGDDFIAEVHKHLG